jgi:hypothetical protein
VTVATWHRQRVCERAYAIWEEEGWQHGNDLSHWLRAEVEVPLRVTFDSNAYRQVIDPNRHRDASLGDLEKINRALKGGRVHGFLSETLITLEGIQKEDRVNVLSSTAGPAVVVHGQTHNHPLPNPQAEQEAARSGNFSMGSRCAKAGHALLASG